MSQNQGKHTIHQDPESQNATNDSTLVANGSNHVQAVTSASGTNQCKVKVPNLYFHFFFDGTGNNKHNTRVRLDKIKEENKVNPNSTILIDSQEKCDELATQESYKNFNISFRDLYDKCSKYTTVIQDINQYIDILSPKEKALRNIDRPEKPQRIGNECYDNLNKTKYEQEIRPYKEVERDLAQNKEKYLNKYDDLSYYNYYSNIALLSDAINISELINHYVFYAGGAGTISFGKDDESGAAYAHGETGVDRRIVQAIAELKKLLKSLNLDNNICNPSDKITININLYGFSRGAFYARNFYSELKKLINSNDPDLKLNKFRMIFKLGIFLDTVTSEGLVHSNDVGEFDLDQDYADMEIYPICAQDEFRYHFPLTSIPKCLKSNKNSIEIVIPGSHSDIGGGYSEVYDEKDQDLGFATLYDIDGHEFQYVPFYWFLNKGYYYLNEEGRFFEQNTNPLINGALTIRNRRVKCIKRRVYYPYQFVTARIMQKIMIDNFGQRILDQGSEFCQQINNLKNWKIDKDGEHFDGIFTLSDYADRIIQWLPFKGNEDYRISKAKFQESNIFDPSKIEYEISEASMKYIYNNYIHYSLVNSPDLSKSEVDMKQRQKNGFYIAYHGNIRKTKPIRSDDNKDFDLVALFPYVDESKITSNQTEMSRASTEIKNKREAIIKNFDRFMLGADYNKCNDPKNTQGYTTPLYGYLQDKFATTDSTVNNNKDQLPSFDQNVIRFCPIERVEITRDRPFLLDPEWKEIFHTTKPEKQ